MHSPLRLLGKVIAPGGPLDHSDYRSELTGILAIMVIVDLVCKYYWIMEGTIEKGCDGLAALNKAFTTDYLIKMDDSNHNLLCAIRTLWNNSPLLWKTRHILGHQVKIMM
jgi:hypothetical protein